MNSATLPILVALLVQLALGLVVFLANRHLKSNQTFLLLSVGGAVWLGCVFYASTAADPQQAAFWIRQASAAAVVNLAGFNLLRLSIRERQSSWGTILRESALWIVLTIAAVVFCQTHWFLKGAHFSHVLGSAAPKPDYNHPGVYVYGTYFILTIVAIVIATLRDLRTTDGAVRSELGFILLGGLCTVAFSVLVSVVLGYFFEPARLLWFAPLRVVLFSAIVAYGIVTRKMMEVGVLLRRLISYALLAAYLLALYALVWWLVTTALQSSIANAHTIAHVTAAVVIAFAM